MKKIILSICIIILCFFNFNRHKVESQYSHVILCAESHEYNRLKNKENVIPVYTVSQYFKTHQKCIIKFSNVTELLENKDILNEDNKITAFYFGDDTIISNEADVENILRQCSEINDNISDKILFLSSEFSLQKDLKVFEKIFSKRISRIHGLKKLEYLRVDRDLLFNRYSRAYKERSVRFLQLAVFSSEDKNEYIDKLREYLGENISCNIEPLTPNFPVDIYPEIIFSVNVILFLTFLSYFDMRQKYKIILLSAVLIISVIIYLFFSQWQQIFSLLISVCYPLISMILLIMKKVWTAPVSVAIIGGLSVSVLLGTKSFILRTDVFRGVKLSLIVPMIVTALLYCFFIKLKISDIPHMKYFIFFSFCILALYVLRSGNWAKFLITSYEVKFRDILENIFIIRPRFKEFLLGYPALYIFYFYHTTATKFFNLILVIFISLLPINIINTFCHIHTPLKYSLLRVFNGFITGTVFSFIMIFIGSIIFKKRSIS